VGDVNIPQKSILRSSKQKHQWKNIINYTVNWKYKADTKCSIQSLYRKCSF
jgi:hypothetical protein